MDFRPTLDVRDGEERKDEMRTTLLRLTRCSGCEGISPFRGATRRISLFFGAFTLVALAMGLSPVPASAQGNCVQDEYQAAGNSQKLNCTANDVRVAKAINVRGLDGTPLTTCNAGSNFSFIADFLVQTTAKSTRSNIGLYFATAAGQTTALTGQCSDNIIPPNDPLNTCSALTSGGVLCGSTHYDELDDSPDNCGDSSSTDPTVCLNANNQVVSCTDSSVAATFPSTQIVTVEVDNMACPAAGEQVTLPNCTSWQIPGKTILCQASPHFYPYPKDTNGHAEAIPGSPSKCNCDTIPLGITSQSPNVDVVKNCTTPNGSSNWALPGPASTISGCTLTPEGGDVTYTVSITNASNFGDITITQVCDSQYGQIYTASGVTPSCAKGALCTTGAGTGCANSTTCSSSTLADISTTGSCTFTVTQAEAVTVKDTASVLGQGLSGGGSFGPISSNEVDVTSNEAATTGTITKSYVSTNNVCATVRYNVDVKNTSAGGTDETMTLSALSDNTFGDITKYTGSTPTPNMLVLGTTCNVATSSPGLGTLSGLMGAGAFPYTLPVNGGDYTCQFDAQFCAAPSSITTTAGTCDIGSGTCTTGKTGSCGKDADCDITCTGIQHSNQVSATLTGDEGVTDVVSLTPGALTVNECINPQ